MKTIDLNTWPRRKTYEFYSSLDYPHFNLCADVDITRLKESCANSGISLFKAVLFGVSKAANTVEELRYRIRETEIVVHEAVHPSFTVLTDDRQFAFCESKFTDDPLDFFEQTDRAIAEVKESPDLKDEPGRDDYLFVTSIPWVRFTSIVHPVHMSPVDSVPRLTWGKFSPDRDHLIMPLSIQVHHGLADGYHVGRFYTLFQEWADDVRF